MEPATTTGPVHFLNLEYFFRLIYEARTGVFSFSLERIASWWEEIWRMTSVIGFIFTLVAIAILVYSNPQNSPRRASPVQYYRGRRA
jgi:hypothetical protein